MNIKNELEVIQLITEDQWMMDILHTAQTLNLPDWWVCAGFVRAKIWDTLSGYKERTRLPDVDVVYYDPNRMDEEIEKQLESKLKKLNPSVPWSVKNEARMHKKNGVLPYTSATDAISKFPETVTALGVKIDENGEVVLLAPWGLTDVLNFEVRPSPFFKENKELSYIYEQRLKNKKWDETWPNVTFYPLEVE